ncbi:MAG: ATP-binding protein [Rhizobacter sp.]
MMRRRPSPLRRKIMLVVLSTTLGALLMSGAIVLLYELHSYRQAWVDDLTSQAELVARASATALSFDDPKAAAENLSMLRLRPQVRAAAVYTADGRVFARYPADPPPGSIPEEARSPGATFDGDDLSVFQRVSQDGEVVGFVYLNARHDIVDRLVGYGLILAVVTAVSLALSALIFSRLQHRVTRPILAVSRAARDVISRQDYSLRVQRTTDDEVGDLVDAFNDMVAEVGRRTEALERSNNDLSVEMLERQRAEDALRAADRRKDEFLATLAHELRNPLAPLSNGLELLKRHDLASAVGLRTREIMERQLRQMVRLIDDLLELSRITTGKLALRREALDLRQLLHTELDAVTPTMSARGHGLSVTIPDQPLWVHGDATRLAQVFANLLNNAAKYTDPGGLIDVDVRTAGTRVMVDISDNGIGIAPAMQEAIFEMFMQVDRSLERGRAGLGLGLTLAKQLIDLHGGDIKVFSPGLGLGSRFTVTLPLTQPPAGSVPRAQGDDATVPAAADLPPLDILVADDNVDFAESLTELLRAQGHQVRVVHDGWSALNEAIASPPQVAFFDIGMPGLNGYDLAERLRRHNAGRHIRMIAITGWGQAADRERARQAGFDHHLTKPVSLEQELGALS